MDTKGKIKDIYSLTPMQQGMLFHSLQDTGSLAYHEISSFRVEGHIDVDAMRTSLRKLIDRYDILRTIFVYKNLDKPKQVVLKQREPEFQFHDIRGYSDNEAREKFIDDYKRKDKAARYKLDKDVLLRMAIIQCDEREFEIFWSHHHIIMDGWCSGILINELFEIYFGILTNQKVNLPEVTPYSDYIKWIEKQDKDASLLFWKDQLKDYNKPVFLPKPINQIKEKGFRQKELELKINRKDTEALNKIARTCEVTLFTCLKSIWSLLLSKVNNVSDCVYGTVVSGRPAEVCGIETMVGLFINTIPCRTSYGAHDSFQDLLKQVQKNSIAAEQHHYISLAEIQESTPCKNQLFDHILVYENYPVNPADEISSNDFKITKSDIYEQANYDLGVVIMPGDELTIKFLYNASFHDEDSINNLSSLFNHLKDEVIKNPEVQLSNLNLLSENESDFLTKEFNVNQQPVPSGITLIHQFDDVVKQVPENTAVIDETGQYSYRILDEKANAIAHHLIQRGIGPEDNVGIFTEQNIDLAASILGVLKSGAAYVPVDPHLPNDRINFIIKNADIKIILTDIEDASFNDCHAVLLKEIASNTTPVNKTQPEQRAYIIYTSGTTGNPKGVEVEHRGVLNTILCRKTEYRIDSNDVCLQLFASAFDGFVTAFFTPIISGASVIFLNNAARRNASTISSQIEKYGVTHFIAVPALLNEIVHAATPAQLKTLRLITLAGEKASMRLIELCAGLNPDMEISQEYGVTEASVMSTMFRDQQKAFVSFIGSPVWNTKIYILDNEMKPAPIGINGNIWIGGIGVARGYYNNEVLTTAKFIKNPFCLGERIYNTGDTGRWLPDGTIEYFGRNDSQIKLRGLRIEPGEVEDHLLRHERIRQALVLKRVLNHDDILCAYYVSSEKLDHNSLRNFLMQKLPAYAVPSVYCHLDCMPVTSNGKIDNTRLPDPEMSNIPKITQPRNNNELELQGIFAAVLGINSEKIGIDSDFFQSGGHSLRAVGLFAKIHKCFNVELPLEVIFRCPTIRLLSQEIAHYQQNTFSNIPQAEPKPHYALSAAQKRQYILFGMNKQSIGYNMPAAFELQGDIDVERLERTFEKIIARHESMRTSFELIDNEPRQIIHNAASFKIQKLSSRSRSETYRLFKDFVKPFDLSAAPLIRVALVNEAKNQYVLLIDMHHIIADGTSIMILLREFTQIYIGEEPQKPGLQYKDFAEWQGRLMNDGTYKKHSEYWLKVFDEEPPVLDLPADFTRPPVKSYDGAQESFTISRSNKDKISAISHQHKTTPFVIFLSIIKVLLSKLSGQHDVVVGTSTAGRSHADMENAIGMFINTLPIRSKFTEEYSFTQLLNTVRDASINAFQHQDFQFEELLETLSLTRDPSRNPLFDIMFIFQNIEASDFSIPGVTINPIQNDVKISKFDITFEIFENSDEFIVNIEYCTKLFTRNSIVKLGEYLTHITDVICNNPVTKISEIRLQSDAALLSRCMDFNRTEKHVAKEQTIIQIFEERVKEAPEHIALIASAEKLSYAELNDRAEILARALTAREVKPNTVVAVFGGRSVETVVGILAVLKSGGAYLPVDVNYPMERIKYMLENAGVTHMVSDRHTPLSQDIDCFIDVRDFMSYCHYEGEIINDARLEDLAYVIYTSGTTGNPKGVKVRNRGVVNTLLCRQAEYGLNRKDVCAQLFSPSFDGFVTSMFTPLISGASVLLISDEAIRDVHKLNKLLIANHVSHFISVPVLFNEIVRNIGPDQLPALKSVTLAGDRLSSDLIQTATKKFPGTEIAQEYGVTEASVMSTMFRNQHVHDKLLIGKPVWNTQIFILDKARKLQPVGVPGEIHIAGIGVAAGYINNEKLTSEKFFANPFNPSQMMYATGDIGRWTEEGNIEFIGRKDHQVKIRGFRIELGEIESRIRSLDEIADVVVIDRNDMRGNKHLCAYYVRNKEIEPDKIRGYLINCLPGFMIPHEIVEVEKFPLTENGKIDVKALRKRNIHVQESNVYVAPKTDTEKHLVSIWEKVLDREQIGVKDNYFSLGGDSIKAIQIAAKLKDDGYEIDITKIFQRPTIEEMAMYIRSSTRENIDDDYEGYIPLTAGLRELIGRNENWGTQFQTKCIHLKEQTAVADLEEIINFIYKTREGLRLIYKDHQVFLNKYSRNNFIIVANTVDATQEEYVRAAVDAFRLNEGPLMRAVVVNNDSVTSITFILHEMLTDDWSWKILLEDFNILLHQHKNKVPFKLSQDIGSIKEYATLTERYCNSHEFEADKEYWKENTFHNAPIFNRKKTLVGSQKTSRVVFDDSFSAQFLSSANEAFQTNPFELFLSALVLACGKIEYQDDYSFVIHNENREGISENNAYRRTIGRFKTQYPIKLPHIADDLSRQIRGTREILRRINRNGIAYQMSWTKKSADEDLTIGVSYFDLINYNFDDCQFNIEKFFEAAVSDKIDIRCYAHPDKLEVAIAYPQETCDPAHISVLSDSLRQSMEEILRYCLATDFVVDSPGDLTYKNISVDAFDSLESFFESDSAR